MSATETPVLIRLIELIGRGLSRDAIAAELGVHPTRVWQLRQTAEFKQLWDNVAASALEVTKQNYIARAERAGERTAELMEQATNLRVALSAAQDIQDRAGLKPRTEVENVHIVRIERSTLAGFARAARDIGAGRAPRVVEAEFERLALLPDEGSPSQEQANHTSAPADVRPPTI